MGIATRRSTRSLGLATATLALLALSALGCRVEREREGDMPDVDVDVESGRLPDYDVHGPDVDVGTTERTVRVPKLRVDMEEERIRVPYIDVDFPDDAEDAPADVAAGPPGSDRAAGDSRVAARQDQTLTVALDVPDPSYDLSIEEIYLDGRELVVVSRLDGASDAIGDATAPAGSEARVSDTVVVRTPEELAVRHYVIGPRVDAASDYRFVGDRIEVEAELDGARLIYRAGSGPLSSRELLSLR